MHLAISGFALLIVVTMLNLKSAKVYGDPIMKMPLVK